MEGDVHVDRQCQNLIRADGWVTSKHTFFMNIQVHITAKRKNAVIMVSFSSKEYKEDNS